MAIWTRAISAGAGGALVGLGLVAMLGPAGCNGTTEKQSGSGTRTSHIATITSAVQFDRQVLKADKPVVVDFFAVLCGRCKRLEPVLEKLAGEYQDRAVFVRVDGDKSPDLMRAYGISAYPTVVVFHKGKQGVPLVGVKSAGTYRRAIDGELAKGT